MLGQEGQKGKKGSPGTKGDKGDSVGPQGRESHGINFNALCRKKFATLPLISHKV